MPTAPALLECPKCHSIVDFSKPQEDESHVLCGKCGHDFGTYRNVQDAAHRAIEQANLFANTPPTKH